MLDAPKSTFPVTSAPPLPAHEPARAPTLLAALAADAALHLRLHAASEGSALRGALVALRRTRGLLLLGHHRVARAATSWRPPGPAGRVLGAAIRVLFSATDHAVTVVARSELRRGSEIGPGVFLSSDGAMFLGAGRIGSGTVIHDHVTIGRSALHPGLPVLGRNVWVGPGAVIVGHLTVGDGATILPGAVLTRSVPAGFVAGGNPAQYVRRAFDNARLRAGLDTQVPEVVDSRAAH